MVKMEKFVEIGKFDILGVFIELCNNGNVVKF